MRDPDFEIGAGNNRLAGWKTGSGAAVLVLHGGPGLSEYTAGLEDELADGYTVIRFQQRGLSPSSTAGPFDVESAIEDVIRVLDQFGLAQALVIGHSWGGHLLLHLLAARPERIAGALIVDPLGAVPDGGEADLSRILGERASPEAAARAEELDQRAMQGEGTPEEAIEALKLVWPGYFANPQTAVPMPEMQISLESYSQIFDSIHQHFQRQTLVSKLPRVSVPTTFLLGADSPIPPHHGIASAALIPGASLRVLADCGHMVWMEKPGAVRDELDLLRARAGL